MQKTIKAYELLINLNLTYTNGVRVEVADPNNPGPFLGYPESLTAIANLLDEGKTDLTGSEIPSVSLMDFRWQRTVLL